MGPENLNLGKENRVRDVNRGSGAGKKSVLKTGKGYGPQLSGPRSNKPTKGLIYGPTRGAKEDSREVIASGKRLRVEEQNVGREGGVFSTKSTAMVVTRSPVQAREEMTGEKGGEVNGDGMSSISVMEENPMELASPAIAK